jgi:hypothetical protein
MGLFAFLTPLLSKITASSVAKAAIGGAVSAVAGNIGRKTTNPSIDFQAMRDDAQRAGFNPLTVMRSGGMSGYMIPAMSKQSFAGQMLGGAMTGAFDAWANKDIDAYNAEVRRLDIEQRKADLSISRSTISQMNTPATRDYMQDYLENPDGFTQMRSIAGENIMVRNDILYRLRLPPGAVYGIAEDAEAVFGEIGGEITGVGNIGDTAVNPIVTTPIHVTPLDGSENGLLSSSWLENLLGPIEKNWNMGTPNLTGLAR